MTDQPVEPKKDAPAAETAPVPEVAKAPEAVPAPQPAPESTPVVAEAKPKAPLVQSKEKPKAGFLSRAFDAAIYYSVNWPVKMALKAAWLPNKLLLKLAKNVAWTDKTWKQRAVRLPVAAIALASVFANEAIPVAYTLGYAAIEASEVVPYSEGKNKGEIQKIRNKGGFWPCQSWEVEIASNTFAADEQGRMTNRYNVSVRRFMPWSKPDIIKEFEKIQSEGRAVEVNTVQSQIATDLFTDEPGSIQGGWLYRTAGRVLSCVQKSPYNVKGEIRAIDSKGIVQPFGSPAPG